MIKYEFRLTPGFCLYNGVAIINQIGSEISFLIESIENEELKLRVEKAFNNHVYYARRQIDCPASYKKNLKIDFKKGNRTEIKKLVSGLYRYSTAEASYVAEKNDVIYGTEVDGITKDENAAAVLLLDTILDEAKERNATDIHIDGNVIKFRISARLQEYIRLSEKRCEELIQRIKLLSGMNVIEKRKSQDGQIIYRKEGRLFVRVSIVPVFNGEKDSYGETVVMRLLDPDRKPLKLEHLGFNQNQIEKMKLLDCEKNGLILICGPTGAGKSTTAAALLSDIVEISRGSKKIISLEDPPEFVIPGVSQIHIDSDLENTFGNVLKHIFRQDPDVLMIGEIRDEESAAAAIRAGLTGHLVFATLHTNNSAGAVLRMENLGVDRKILAGILKGVIVQELNYMEETAVLLADVSTPCEGFADKITKDMGINAIENLFVPEVNGAEVLSFTLKTMKQQQLLEDDSLSQNLSSEPYFVRTKRKSLPLLGWENEKSIAAGNER